MRRTLCMPQRMQSSEGSKNTLVLRVMRPEEISVQIYTPGDTRWHACNGYDTPAS